MSLWATLVMGGTPLVSPVVGGSAMPSDRAPRSPGEPSA
ncbi:membrane protein [Cutibacterium acnes JCM 18920]|nr:membrane protein [Cutibacterium acnes JCM 18920]